MHQRARQRHALPLAAGQPCRPRLCAVGQAHLRQHFGRLATPRARQGQRHVVQHALPRQQARILEHHAHVGAALAAAFRVVLRVTVDRNGAGIGAFQPRHQPQQRALAAAAAPDDGDEFTRRNVERHIVQHLAAVVALDHLAQAQRDATSAVRSLCLVPDCLATRESRFQFGQRGLFHRIHLHVDLLAGCAALRGSGGSGGSGGGVTGVPAQPVALQPA
ncbi:hypothetical protein D3C81_1132520 [compost metagenome]